MEKGVLCQIAFFKDTSECFRNFPDLEQVTGDKKKKHEKQSDPAGNQQAAGKTFHADPSGQSHSESLQNQTCREADKQHLDISHIHFPALQVDASAIPE
jgi:hypothetical protein